MAKIIELILTTEFEYGGKGTPDDPHYRRVDRMLYTKDGKLVAWHKDYEQGNHKDSWFDASLLAE